MSLESLLKSMLEEEKINKFIELNLDESLDASKGAFQTEFPEHFLRKNP